MEILGLLNAVSHSRITEHPRIVLAPAHAQSRQ